MRVIETMFASLFTICNVCVCVVYAEQCAVAVVCNVPKEGRALGEQEYYE